MSILANISCNISKTVKKTRTGQKSSVAVQFSNSGVYIQHSVRQDCRGGSLAGTPVASV